MEWQQLEYFQTVAKLQHFTRAAEALFISQPALSRSIARLEKELGVPLFERRGRTVQLNRYGDIFLGKVNKAIQTVEEGKREIEHEIQPDHGNIALAFLHTLGSNLVPDLLSSFRERHPDVSFQLFQNTTNRLWEQLYAGDVDLALASPSFGDAGHTVWRQLFSEELFAVVPYNHRLAERREIDLNEMADEPFIGLRSGLGITSLTDELCREAGFSPKKAFEGEEVGTVAGLVSAGLGVGLIPDIVGLDSRRLVKIHVRKPVCRRRIGVAWNEERYLSPVAKQFRTFVMDYFSSGEK